VKFFVEPEESSEFWIANAKAVLDRHQGGKGLLVDIGAHVGTLAILAVKEYGFTSVVAVEPNLDNFGRMIENISYNDCEGRILPIWAAISNKTLATTKLYQPPKSSKGVTSGCWSLIPYDTLCHQRVLSLKLDDVCNLVGSKTIDLLKIDVEGAEYDIIDSTYHEKIRAIDIELHPVESYGFGEIKDILEMEGFKCSDTTTRLAGELGAWGLYCKR
jgi:FkbM family methyltransferase